MRKRLAGMLLAALVWLSSASAQPSGMSHWLALEQQWNAAHLKGDSGVLDELWSEDITVLVPGMALLDKATSLGMWRSGTVRFTKYESFDIRVRETGDTAIVTGRLQRSRDFGGRVASENWNFTKVYAKRGGRWQVVAFHASDAP